MKFELPYGKTRLPLELKDSEVVSVLTSGTEEYRPDGTESELVERAMKNPIGSPRLCELAKGKKKVVIIASDHTRPVPSKFIIPPMLKEIREGNPAAEITILIATGCHRPTTDAELRAKFGDEIVDSEKIIVHNCADESMLTKLGTLPSGGELIINKTAVEADLLCSEGFIEPHFFAGFSGGRKSVLPGIASKKTVYANHCGAFIESKAARTGLTVGNPINVDMEYAAEKAGLRYIVNVVLNGKKQIINAFAGDTVKAHDTGCEFVKSLCCRKATPSDIVISTNGGYPLDQNIYQSVKGMTAAEAAVKKGGVIIMLSRADDGHGGEGFCRFFRQPKTNDELAADFAATPADMTLPDQWQAQILVRILRRATVIYVSDAPRSLIEELRMTYASSLPEAVEMARKIAPKNPTFTVIPDGVAVTVLE